MCENSCQCRASPKNLATGTAFAIVFVTGFGMAGSVKLKTNCGRKPLILKELRNSHWTASPSKYTPAEPACPSGVSVRMPPFLGQSRGGRATKSHIIVADDPEGQRLLEPIPKQICHTKPLLMDQAYEGGIIVTGHGVTKMQCCDFELAIPSSIFRCDKLGAMYASCTASAHVARF